MSGDRTTHFVNVDWGKLAYTSHGRGEQTVVLLHQLLMDKRIQWVVADHLAAREGCRVICLDLPGHGESDAPRDAAAYGLPTTAAAVADTVAALDVGPVVLGGASLGSVHALRVAITRPDLIDALWLEMPIVDKGIRNACYWGSFALAGYTLASPLLRVLPFRRDPVATRLMLTALISDGIRPWIEGWSQVTVPTLVTGHPWDPVHVRSDARRLAAGLSDGRYMESRSILALRRNPAETMSDVSSLVRDAAERREAVWTPM